MTECFDFYRKIIIFFKVKRGLLEETPLIILKDEYDGNYPSILLSINFNGGPGEDPKQ